jgi:hypothetical protein
VFQPCNVLSTVKHMLIGCAKYVSQRANHFNHCNLLEDLFTSFSSHVILDFVKEIGIYRKLWDSISYLHILSCSRCIIFISYISALYLSKIVI